MDISGLVMGFREGLEAFLIIAIMLEYFTKANKPEFKVFVKRGLGLGILVSIVFALLLMWIAVAIGQSGDYFRKLWEAIASFIALGFVSMFIVWMIQHGSNMVKEVTSKTAKAVSGTAVMLLATFMVAREGAEIGLFAFAATKTNEYLIGTFVGIVLSAILTFLIYKSLVKVNLKLIFRITLIYLILQAGFLLGYSIHELLSFFKDTGVLESTSWIYTKAYDLSAGVFNHKEGIIGLPLYVTIGWYSKPEVVQFLIQYLYTGSFLYLMFRQNKKEV